MIGKTISMTQNRKCPEGADCPYKAGKAREAIRSMPEHLKGQETANMESTEAHMGNDVLLSELLRYQRTGVTAEQLELLLEHLQGECWLCEHSKPYDISPSRKLCVCELGYPDREKENTKPVAMIRDKSCSRWKLKHFERIEQ